jgi:hypothetical protein
MKATLLLLISSFILVKRFLLVQVCSALQRRPDTLYAAYSTDVTAYTLDMLCPFNFDCTGYCTEQLEQLQAQLFADGRSVIASVITAEAAIVLTARTAL